MSAKTRIPLHEAERLATEVLLLLAPACERLSVAGSIRRRKPDVGDIEVVAIPTLIAQPDLFGGDGGEPRNLLEERVEELLAAEDLTPRRNKVGQPALGRQNKLLTFRGFALDLFITDADRWAVTFAIRTGPSDFSHALVTPRNQMARDRETGGSICAGLCHPWLEVKGWRVRHRDDHEVYPTPTEESVFKQLGVPWLEPQERDGFILARSAVAVVR